MGAGVDGKPSGRGAEVAGEGVEDSVGGVSLLTNICFRLLAMAVSWPVKAATKVATVTKPANDNAMVRFLVLLVAINGSIGRGGCHSPHDYAVAPAGSSLNATNDVTAGCHQRLAMPLDWFWCRSSGEDGK